MGTPKHMIKEIPAEQVSPPLKKLSGIRILVVEDERALARSIGKMLTREGFTVGFAYNGVEATEKAWAEEFNFMILDLNLPGKSGFEVLQELRTKNHTVPILILSARERVEDRIKALELGADDYLVKPFDSGELVARVRAILQRGGLLRSNVLQAADLVVDVVHRKVTRGEKEITLTQREFALLEFLLRNKNQLLTRRRIAEQVWGYTFDSGTNLVDVYVSYLRRALDDGFAKKLIHTVRGEGFMLVDRD
jgi:DNA-binding response OmpR family regulator